MKNIQINFRGNKILCWMKEQPQDAVIAIKPICEVIGIDPVTQIRKIQSDPKFSCRHMPSTGSDGKQYQMVCLPIGQLAIWLCGINSNKTKAAVRPTLLEYQQYCQMELWAAINGTAGIDVVAALKAEVEELRKAREQDRLQYTAELSVLRTLIESLTAAFNRVGAPVEHILRKEASQAGSRLAAQRQVNRYLQ